MAAELKLVQPESTVTLVHSKTQLLSSEPLPDIAKERTMSLMHEAGVRTVMGVRVTKVLRRETHQPGSTEYQVTLSDGRDIKAGFVINAVSKFAPTTSYLPIDVLDEDGYVKIKPKYISFSHPTHFLLGTNLTSVVWNLVAIFRTHLAIMRLATSLLGLESNGAVPPCIKVIIRPLTFTRRC